MLPLIARLGTIALLGAALAACGKDDNAPGPQANSGKTYSLSDANAAQPMRGAAAKAANGDGR
jgi:hypothetical protein